VNKSKKKKKKEEEERKRKRKVQPLQYVYIYLTCPHKREEGRFELVTSASLGVVSTD
jgi:hypothetical protein